MGGLFLFGISLMLTYAYAFSGDAPYIYPIGTRNTCDAGVKATLNGDWNLTAILDGPATFETKANSLPGEAFAWTDLKVIDLRHQGNDPRLGDYLLEADIARSGLSRIEALVAFRPFPARSTLRFHGSLSLANSTIRYTSVDEVVIEKKDLDHWPHHNDVYQQVGTATFISPSGGKIVLSNASVIVTAQ